MANIRPTINFWAHTKEGGYWTEVSDEETKKDRSTYGISTGLMVRYAASRPE